MKSHEVAQARHLAELAQCLPRLRVRSGMKSPAKLSAKLSEPRNRWRYVKRRPKGRLSGAVHSCNPFSRLLHERCNCENTSTPTSGC